MLSMILDHVIFAVTDLNLAAEELFESHGLASVPGGRHLAWGTANRIVPLGESYIELVAVDDPGVAITSSFGRWVSTAVTAGSLEPLGWAVRTDDLAAVCDRLRLAAVGGSRQNSDGQVLEWMLAGIEQAAVQPIRPFFIQWGTHTPLPGTTPVRHPRGESSLARVHLRGDAEQLMSWVGNSALPVSLVPGLAAVTGIDIISAGQTWTLGGKPI